MAEVKEVASQLLELTNKNGSAKGRKKSINAPTFTVPKAKEKTLQLQSALTTPSTNLNKKTISSDSALQAQRKLVDSSVTTKTKQEDVVMNPTSKAEETPLVKAFENMIDEEDIISPVLITDSADKISLFSQEEKLFTAKEVESEAQLQAISLTESKVESLDTDPEILSITSPIVSPQTEVEDEEVILELDSITTHNQKKKKAEKPLATVTTDTIVTNPMIIALPQSTTVIVAKEDASSLPSPIEKSLTSTESNLLGSIETDASERGDIITTLNEGISSKTTNGKSIKTKSDNSIFQDKARLSSLEIDNSSTSSVITPTMQASDLSLDLSKFNLDQEQVATHEEMVEDLNIQDFSRPETLMVATKHTMNSALSTSFATEEAKPIDQIKLALTQNLHTNKQKLTVALTPEYLGKIEIEITVEKGQQTQIKIFTEQKDTLELLINDSVNLKQAISEVTKSADVDLSFNLKDGQSNDSSQEQQPNTNLYRSPADEQNSIIVKKAGSSSHHLSNSAVDIRV